MGKAFRSYGNGTKGRKPLTGDPDRAQPAGTNDDKTDAKQTVIRPWATLLSETIQSEILPRLLAAQDGAANHSGAQICCSPTESDVKEFVDLIIADDMEQVRTVADRVIVQSGGRDALLQCLLTPAAQLLGVMWEQDVCDFMTVTLGVYRLDQIMKETATVGNESNVLAGHDHRILLLPSPGEQHSFGLGMVADVFREGGWCVRSGPAVTRSKLLRLVRDEWFDVVGLSVTAERALKGMPSLIRAIRHASCNTDVYVMVGGRAVVDHVERARFLGADATAIDAHHALAEANIFVETNVTDGLRRSKTRLVELG